MESVAQALIIGFHALGGGVVCRRLACVRRATTFTAIIRAGEKGSLCLMCGSLIE